MSELILKTTNDWTGLVLRLTAGLIMLPHGLQKTYGLFGGYGFKNTLMYFTQTMKLPWALAVTVIVLEFIGPLGLITGAFSRVWAIALACIMVGAIVTTNARNGLFMNWYGNQNGEGFEYHLLYIGICIAIVISGSGRYSVDRYLLQSN